MAEGMNMSDYWKDLRIWKEAHHIVLTIYEITNRFPKSEKYGLISQIRRAAVSIPANIVEGNSRGTLKSFLSFLYIARGSLEELRYLIYLAKDLDYINQNDYQRIEKKCIKLSIKLNRMIQSLKSP